jgi:hypothetical protein
VSRLLLPDNAKAIFGAGSDLQIYHGGSNSYVQDAGGRSINFKHNGGVISINGDATVDNDGVSSYWKATSGNHYFQVGGATKMTLDSSGNLTVPQVAQSLTKVA